MQITDLEGIVEGTLLNDSSFSIEGFSTDSRKVEKGNLYIPLVGENYNGNDFILDAIRCGATCVLIEKGYSLKASLLNQIGDDIGVIEVESGLAALKAIASFKRDNYSGKVIAITGSVGKTTTKEMLYAVLKQKYNVFKSDKNYNNMIGLCQMLLQLKEEEVAIFELGMNQLHEISEMSQLLKPDIGIITNIGSAHVGNLGSIENILKAKLEIIDGMQTTSLLLLNGDDTHLRNLTLPVRTMYYNTSEVRVTSLLDQLVLHLQDEIFIIDAPGRHHIEIAMCTICVARLFDMNNTEIRKGLITYQAVRMKKIAVDRAIVIDDTYNASYESMKNGIDYVEHLGDKRKIVVLGDMLELGDYTLYYHQLLGEYLSHTSIDEVLTYGEVSQYIGEKSHKKWTHYRLIEDLISDLKQSVKEDCIIYLKASRKIGLEKVTDALKK